MCRRGIVHKFIWSIVFNHIPKLKEEISGYLDNNDGEYPKLIRNTLKSDIKLIH